MTRPRNEQISVADTPYYHIVSRCVRRTYLCGTDHSTGKCFEHRRQWIENRIRLLSSLFGVDICAYAVMSNHLHVVVKLNPAEIDALTNLEVAQRWMSLFKGPLLVQKWLQDVQIDKSEQEAIDDCIKQYRKRLASLSWFMKSLNEPIARQANKEDGCTGHFWESRYKSQALLTEEALLSCMTYVDLNPVRASMADTPETSEHTSIKERINPQFNLGEAVKEQVELEALLQFNTSLKPLVKFGGNVKNEKQSGILFSLCDYLELVDYTGRCIREDKRGAIPSHLPPILKRLGIDQKVWLNSATAFEKCYLKRFSRQAVQKQNAA